ncbi:hypothetical protein KFL_003680180 [Klebsormidium nitens]|uniref:C2H2-type domain-containing protein n=1 Tax=Klebsormidium nitens TaxID=105231 RepID=A0A1Y1IHP5_KLENI|nr:hypothetical protein KFL_003680180 [Klebsormidium nitens]|eukprot:GAQ87668.1 hypothetical protein KFL_003680180 [Klebsormidium nitens]
MLLTPLPACCAARWPLALAAAPPLALTRGPLLQGDDSGDDDDMDDGEAGAGDAYGRRRAGRPRMKKAGKYQCRKCDATFPTSRGRDGHQRMHGPSAGAVVRRGPSAEPYHDGAPYGPMAAGWGSDDADPTREAAPEPPPAQYAQVNLATGEARADDRAAEEGGEGQPATVGPGAEEVGAGDMLPFTAARSRRMRKPRRFESFEWQTDEWRREEKMDETAPPVGADGSGSDGDMESSGSERDAHVFACNECTAVFPSARSLGSHRKLHRSERRRRLEELRAMSEDGHYGSEVGPKAEPHAAGAPAERREAAEPHAKARALEVGREVYGGCILANGRYRCNTCFKDFGTGQALGGHQRIHSSGPTPAKKKAPKALAKPRKRAPTGTHPKEPHRAAFGRPLSASGSRCVVPGRPAWMDDDDDEEAEEEVRMGGGGEGGWRNAAEESPVGTGRDVAQRWEATAGGGGAECEDSAELLMAIHFQQQERERERERGVAQRGITKPLAASPLGVKARLGAAATAGSEPPQDVEMTVASPTEKVAPAAAQPVAIGIGGPRPRAVAVGGAWHAAARLSAEWAENVPIGQSSVFFPGRAQTDTWPGGEKRKRVLSQLPGASSPESSPANSPQATGPTPSRFHARPTAAHVPAPYRPASMGSPAGAGLSRYGAQALHGQPRGAPETGGRPDPRFLSTLTSSTSAAVTKVGPARLHQCGECGAEFETGAALGGHVGKHRRENEKLREKEAHASDPPSREALRAGIMARVGMSLTPRGGNVKAATARHQAPKKRIMVKFQAQQQQHGPPHPAAPLAAHPAAPSSAYLRMPIAGLSQHPGGAVRLGPYSVPPSQLATGRAPLRLTVQVATSPVVSPARLVRSPTFGRDALPRAAAATASPDPTPRTRDVAALLQNWKAHTDTGGRGEPLQAARTCESPSRTPVRMVSRLAVPPALLTLPNGKADPEAAAPKVLSPGNVNTAARAPMGPLQWEAKLAQRKAASPTGGCKGSSMPAGEGQARTPKARPTGERAVNAPRSAT